MKHWKQVIGALALAMTSTPPAQADLFTVTDGLAGQKVQVKTYNFDISTPAQYVASLIDLNQPLAGEGYNALLCSNLHACSTIARMSV
jgi:hypothetical protein